MAFEVRATNFDARLRKISRAYIDALAQEITLIAIEVERAAKQNLTDLKKVDRGFLRNSIDHEVQTGRGIVEGVTFAGAIHSPWVEFGRHGFRQSPIGTGPNSGKAAWPPVDVIREWIKRNNKSFAVSGRTKSGRARKAKDKDLDAFAFVIARKIANKGIEPTPYLVPAFLEVRPFYRARLAAALKRVQVRGIP